MADETLGSDVLAVVAGCERQAVVPLEWAQFVIDLLNRLDGIQNSPGLLTFKRFIHFFEDGDETLRIRAQIVLLDKNGPVEIRSNNFRHLGFLRHKICFHVIRFFEHRVLLY